MNIVKQWLPRNVYCNSHVFCVDDYAGIMRLFDDFFDDWTLNKHDLLPANLHHTSQIRQLSYLAGRKSALLALKEAGYVADRMLGRTLQGLPDWPQGYMGSISHAVVESHGVAIAVVTHQKDAQSIAVDCEPVFSTEHANEVALLTASANEQRIGERSGLSRDVWLTMVYSLKETLFKLLYTHVNCFMPFEAAEVLSFDVNAGQACLMLSVDWGDLLAGQRFWLKTMQVEVEQVGECVLSFGMV